jgi:O-methyltransferase involved in polyketide biosynthesis
VWEGVTQYLTENAVRATMAALEPAAPGSALAFTYVHRDFIDGVNLYGAKVAVSEVPSAARRLAFRPGARRRRRLAGTVRLASHRERRAGLLCTALHCADRPAAGASQLEWTAYARK